MEFVQQAVAQIVHQVVGLSLHQLEYDFSIDQQVVA